MISTSAFEILGPIMVGPSSSHTAGAARIALVARSLAPDTVVSCRFVLLNSFSRTYKGHGSDKALVAGMLGLAPDDTRVKDSFALAQAAGLEFSFVEAGDDATAHPNTVRVEMTCANGATMSVVGESLGGGRVKISHINDVPVAFSGDYPTLFVAHNDVPGVLAALTACFSSAATNIATMSTFRTSRGGMAYTIFETDEALSEPLIHAARATANVHQVCIIQIPGASPTLPDTPLKLGFSTGAELASLCQTHGLTIGELMLEREAELLGSHQAANKGMRQVLSVMREEVRATLTTPEPSLGGFLYGQAAQVAQTPQALATQLCGTTLTQAMAYAMAVLERSAAMGVIVAAPTAGSAGVVPGSILSAAESAHKDDESIQKALWCSAGIGCIIASNASVAGAEGGCQAEVGTAAAMAAAALVELAGGTVDQAFTAASLAIVNLLGLVCDPVRGLVEFPCQDRNAGGVADAFAAAQLALAGITTPLPFDEVVGVMDAVGKALPSSLRETAQGGLAAAPSCAGCGACS